ncbi:hypothetical protein FHG87_002269 [Trinorchestia longiramus]|nr:hypothetical protein FHG87_002269 [Trinorchestia longiramus]
MKENRKNQGLSSQKQDSQTPTPSVFDSLGLWSASEIGDVHENGVIEKCSHNPKIGFPISSKMGGTSFGEVQPLSYPEYADLNDIGRCVHIDDLQETLEKLFLVPQPLTNSHKHLRRRVLWFAPCQSMSSHNYYGNVTFVISWKTVLQKLGPRIYLLDQAIYHSTSYTRVVLTNRNYDKKFEKVDLNSDNSALIKSRKRFRYAKSCLNNAQNHGPHELQIAIEIDESSARWLLYNCRLVANDHSQANTPFPGTKDKRKRRIEFDSFKCFKFNTQNNTCPYEFNIEQSKESVLAIISETSAKFNLAPILTHGEAIDKVFERLLKLLKRRKKSKNLATSNVKAEKKLNSLPVKPVNTCASGVERLSIKSQATQSKPFKSSAVATKHPQAAVQIQKPMDSERSAVTNSSRFDSTLSRAETLTHSPNSTRISQPLKSVVYERESYYQAYYANNDSTWSNQNVTSLVTSEKNREKMYCCISDKPKESRETFSVRKSATPYVTSQVTGPATEVIPRATSVASKISVSPTYREQNTSLRASSPTVSYSYTASNFSRQNSVSSYRTFAASQSSNYDLRATHRTFGSVPSSPSGKKSLLKAITNWTLGFLKKLHLLWKYIPYHKYIVLLLPLLPLSTYLTCRKDTYLSPSILFRLNL